jgi:NAD(P)H-flavin reductase
MLPDVVKALGVAGDTEAYVCGPPAMVRQAKALLAASLPPSQIHCDPPP